MSKDPMARIVRAAQIESNPEAATELRAIVAFVTELAAMPCERCPRFADEVWRAALDSANHRAWEIAEAAMIKAGSA